MSLSKQTQTLIQKTQSLLDLARENMQDQIEDLSKDLKNLKSAKGSKPKPTTLAVLEEQKKKLQESKIKLTRHGLDGLINEEKDQFILNNLKKGGSKIGARLQDLVTDPISSNSFELLTFLDKQFNAAEKKVGKAYDRVLELSKTKGSVVSLAVVELDHVVRCWDVLEGVSEALDEAQGQKVKTVKLSKPNFYAKERSTFSSTCAKQAQMELNKLRSFDGDLITFGICVADALAHYELGVALLDGEPARIEKAAQMDTVVGDSLGDDLWEFCHQTIPNSKSQPGKNKKKHR